LAKKKHQSRPRPERSESRTSEVVTVVWMMSVVTTVVCGGVAVLVWLAAQSRADSTYPLLFSRLLHFGAFVAAVLSLVLLAVVLKVREHAPPPAITWGSVAAALATILAALLY
jgi:hypothetical protein